VKKTIKKSHGKEEQVLAVNGLRFNDWQGRVGAVVKREGANLLFHLREALRLSVGRSIHQVATNNISAEMKASARALFNPHGVVMAEMRMQGQTIMGKHGIQCCPGRDRSFHKVVKRGKISPHCEFDFGQRLATLCEEVGLGDASCGHFCVQIESKCQCAMKGRLITAGDIIKVDDNTGSSGSKYQCILVFYAAGDGRIPTHAIVMECVVVAESWMGTKLRMHSPSIYRKVEITKETEFIGGLSDCQAMGCELNRGGNKVKHNVNNGGHQLILLDAKKAFPPRQG